MLDEVADFNRASCAILNFPQEHELHTDYLDAITRDLAATWREFALNANTMLLGKGEADEQHLQIG